MPSNHSPKTTSALPIGPSAHDDDHDHEPQSVVGTNGPDQIDTGGGPQTIYGLNGSDIIHAGGGPDTIIAGNGADQVFGQGGPDLIIGGNGADYLDGGPGPDVIEGGNGDDTIIGGIAIDVLTGGRGADTFVFLAANEAPAHGDEEDGHGTATQETITDFKPGTDFIDLSALGVVQGLASGPSAYSVWAVQDGTDTVLYVDTDGVLAGAEAAEMEIRLLDVDAGTLTAGDFIL